MSAVPTPPPADALITMLPDPLRERVHAVSSAIVGVLAWSNPIERLAALSLAEYAALCAVYQATHELPAQLGEGRPS